jgi:hypothetical protein
LCAGELKDVIWKRTSEICENPQLFVDGTEPGDVIQVDGWILRECNLLREIWVIVISWEPYQVPMVIPKLTLCSCGDQEVRHCRCCCLRACRDLLTPLFVSTHPECGFYQIKFWKNAEWQISLLNQFAVFLTQQIVTIDDRIPMYGKKPMFSHCRGTDNFSSVHTSKIPTKFGYLW